MCGRYFVEGEALSAEAFDGYAAYLESMPGGMTPGEADLRPGDEAPALCASGDGMRLDRMRWGFALPDGRRIINARVETMEQKPMFRNLAKEQRCALPATRYYEWRRSDRQRFRIALESTRLFYLAGLYRIGTEGREFVVLTQPPTPRLARIHNRMPVLLGSRHVLEGWFSGDAPLFDDEDRLRIDADGPEQLQMLFM